LSTERDYDFQNLGLSHPEELEYVTSSLAQAEFVDGKLTGWHAKLVKNNHQLKHNEPKVQELKELIKKALSRNALFQTAVRPKIVHSILFSYDMGMSYGRHRQCLDGRLVLAIRHIVYPILELSLNL